MWANLCFYFCSYYAHYPDIGNYRVYLFFGDDSAYLSTNKLTKGYGRRYAVALRFLPGRVHGCDLLHITLAFIVSRGLNIRPGHQRELQIPA